MPTDPIFANLSSETIIFGGLTLVCLALVTLVWRLSVKYGNHMTEFMKMNADAWCENAKSLQKNSDCLNKLNETIERKIPDRKEYKK